MVKINFGASTNTVPGWINYDNALRHIVVSRIPGAAQLLHRLHLLGGLTYDAHATGAMRRLRYADARRRLPHEHSTVDALYSSHMLEHLTWHEAQHFVKEAYRVLRSGGILRIAVPDLEEAVRRYLDGKAQGNDTVDNTEQFVELFFSKDAREFSRYGHRWMYDACTLRALLKGAGFRQVTVESFKHGRCPDVELVDVRSESLFMEATK